MVDGTGKRSVNRWLFLEGLSMASRSQGCIVSERVVDSVWKEIKPAGTRIWEFTYSRCVGHEGTGDIRLDLTEHQVREARAWKEVEGVLIFLLARTLDGEGRR